MYDHVDISIVCNMLDVTSRTLRFYEEKGIVTSTQIDDGKRRQYNEEQIRHIKNVLILRSLGLSVTKINELLTKNGDLKLAILRQSLQKKASTRLEQTNGL
ncbi:MAG: helix-turn-helix domain-containing protein [Eubacteriales bacterium]